MNYRYTLNTEHGLNYKFKAGDVISVSQQLMTTSQRLVVTDITNGAVESQHISLRDVVKPTTPAVAASTKRGRGRPRKTTAVASKVKATKKVTETKPTIKSPIVVSVKNAIVMVTINTKLLAKSIEKRRS